MEYQKVTCLSNFLNTRIMHETFKQICAQTNTAYDIIKIHSLIENSLTLMD